LLFLNIKFKFYWVYNWNKQYNRSRSVALIANSQAASQDKWSLF